MSKRHSVQRTLYNRLASHGQAVFLRGRTRETHEELTPQRRWQIYTPHFRPVEAFMPVKDSRHR